MLAIVILAGGKSKRFGTNKLIYKIDGENMIKRVFRAASEITENIYLSVKDMTQAETLLSVCDGFSGVILDSYKEIDGPINGIITSLNTLRCDEVVTIPGDMPFIDSESLSKFINRCEGLEADSGSIYWPSGWVDVLLQYHRDKKAADYASLSIIRGAMSKASDTLRASKKAYYIPISHLSKDYRTFINVNTLEDLSKINIFPFDSESKIKHVGEEVVRNFLRATSLLRDEATMAAKYYLAEGEKYEDEKLYTLALHAYKDVKICYEKLGKVVEAKEIDMKITHIKSLLGPHR